MSGNSSKNSQEKIGQVLVVDNDEKFLMVTSKVLSKAFKVHTAKSGQEALDKLNNGLNPGVILSDEKMQGMTGSEFLAKSIEIIPETIRIIIPASPDPNNIILCLNKSQALMYMSKPVQNLELFQAVKLGFDYYNSTQNYKEILKDTENKLQEAVTHNDNIKKDLDELNIRNKELNDKYEETSLQLSDASEKVSDLEKRNKDLNDVIKLNSVFPSQMITALSDLIVQSEIFYYREHTPDVISIVVAIAEDLKLEERRTKVLINSALIHNLVLYNLPERMQLLDPYEMDSNQRGTYFFHFNKIIEILRQIDLLKPSAEILNQIWEHYDGSGYPGGLKEDEIYRESQILAIANIYHNLVYRLKAESLDDIRKEGVLTQIIPETKNRHKEAIGSLFKNSKWFDYDVLRSFQDIVKHKECDELIPAAEHLEIDLRRYCDIEVEEKQNPENAPEASNEEQNNGDDTEAVLVPAGEDDEEYIERAIEASDVKPGMISVYNVKTVSGILIVKADKTIDPATTKKLIQMHTSGLIHEKITVRVKQ